MKEVLITAGPTWVPIDNVRVLSNISSGENGILLAEEAFSRGYKVTLLLGPVGDVHIGNSIRVIRFTYFKDLECNLNSILTRKRFDVVLHLAAVSDFAPKRVVKQKISSMKDLTLKLKRTPKLASFIKKIRPKSFLVLFKLEDNIGKVAFKKARKALAASKADLCVLNMLRPYKAQIFNNDMVFGTVKTKKELTKRLFNVIGALQPK